MNRLYNILLPYLTVGFIVLASTIILWLPFILKSSQWFSLKIETPGTNYIYRHYDGPLYTVPARTWYDPAKIEAMRIETALPPSYFAAHLPFYPLIIATFAPLMGYLKSMIFSNLLATVLLACFFYYFVVKLKLTKNPLLLTSVLLFLPRFLVVRSIGAPESLFLFLLLLSLFFFEKRNFLLAGLFGGLSVATKTPGIILAGVYFLVFIEEYLKTKKVNWNYLWILLIPIGLISVFLLYGRQYGDFWAYFHSGDNTHLTFPFSAFNYQKIWVSTAWLEDIAFYFVMYGLAVVYLKDSKYRSLFYFALVFLSATLFVEHRDIARYALPIWPFAVIAFEKFFTSKKFLWIFFLILIPAAFFYGWNFMLTNVMPISDWKPFL